MTLSVGALLRSAAARLDAAGVATARLDAQILLGAALGLSRAALIVGERDPVAAVAAARFERLLARRLAREPISHILGEREFWSRSFRVTADTLAPRPDSETLIDAVLAHWRAGARTPATILDLGTGTGCLLLTLLAECPASVGIGIDLNPATAAVARGNAQTLGLGARAQFVVGHWASALSRPRSAARDDGGFDLIVSNPPYIATAELATLAPEVAVFEPRLALDGGADGLDPYRALIPQAAALLSAQGLLALEIGPTQAGAVSALATEAGFANVRVHQDLERRDRCVLAMDVGA